MRTILLAAAAAAPLANDSGGFGPCRATPAPGARVVFGVGASTLGF